MAKKLLGIVAGRKNGNSEVALKEAFLAARECGDVELQMINLHDCKLLPCTGCEACTRAVTQGKEPICIYKEKDDVDSIMKEFLKTDGLIIAAPCFELQPVGLYKLFCDRFVAYEVAFLMQSGFLKEEPRRVAGLIGVGGSTPTWMSMMLPALAVSMFTQSIKVVDQMMVNRTNRPAQVIARPEYLERARKLGQNVHRAMNTPYDQIAWLGDTDPDYEWCPKCHSNMIIKGHTHWDGKRFPVECAMCGAGGTLEIKDGKYSFVVDPESLKTYRLETGPRTDHFHEIGAGMKFFAEHAEEIKAGLKKYTDFKVPQVPIKFGAAKG